MLGVDGRVRHVGMHTDFEDLTGGSPLGTSGARTATELPWAAYLQQRWTPFARLHLNGGVRFDHEARGGQRLSPRAAATVDAWRGGVLKLIYAEAFRVPTYYELYYEAAGSQTAAPNLRSESVRSAEASVEQKWGAHRLLFGVFRTWWSDMVASEVLADGTSQYQNLSHIDNFGFNAQLEGSRGDVRWGLSVTEAYTRRQTTDGSQMLPVSPSLFGNARIAYDLPGALPTVALAATLVGSRLADRANDGSYVPLPTAPAQARLRLTVSDKVPGHEALSWRVSAEYATAGSSAYVAGPAPSAGGPAPRAELAPVNRFTAFASLQYDLGL
jgi:outer membrane receptor protein involved in Fe transport